MNARSGQSVGQAIQQGVQEVNGGLQHVLSEINRLDEAANDLVERRGQAFLELAEHYLPAVTQQTVSQAFEEIRSELMEVLLRKQRHERELQKTIESDEAESRQLDEELQRVTTALNEKVAQREELEKEVVKRLEGDAEFQRLSTEALTAEKELNRNEERVEDIKNEAAEKLPSFEKSRLFQYLHKRGYGTSGYTKEGLTKRLDGWVAGLINYHRARRSYEFLRVTPELIANEVGRRRDQFNGLMELVEACEDRHADAVGLTAVMREGQELGRKRDGLIADIGKQEDLTEKHRQELSTLETCDNQYYEQAVGRMKEFLSTLESRRLERATRATPEPEDDQIAAELSWLGEELDKTRRRSAELVGEQRIWKKRGAEIHDIWQRFRRADFDSGRSFFHPEFEIEVYLQQFSEGKLSHGELWSMIKAAQQFAPPWYENDRPGGRRYEPDFSYVLLHVLADIAGHALRHVAERGLERRSKLRKMFRSSHGRPPFPDGGFTRGRGF